MYLVTQSKNGISAMDLKRQLGVSYNTAWMVKHKLMQAMVERSDGLSCFRGVEDAGCEHKPRVTGGGKGSCEMPGLTRVNTLLGNVKRAIDGTYHACDPKYVGRYLAEFAYRFNQRYQLADLVPRLAYVAARTPPLPHRLLPDRLRSLLALLS